MVSFHHPNTMDRYHPYESASLSSSDNVLSPSSSAAAARGFAFMQSVRVEGPSKWYDMTSDTNLVVVVVVFVVVHDGYGYGQVLCWVLLSFLLVGMALKEISNLMVPFTFLSSYC